MAQTVIIILLAAILAAAAYSVWRLDKDHPVLPPKHPRQNPSTPDNVEN